jgi:hypothetical protein
MKHKKQPKNHPKDKTNRRKIDAKLLDLFNESGITFSHAAEIAGCSRQYASEQFKKFGDEIEKQQNKFGSWVEKNDAVRIRALEGLSRQVNDSDQRIQDLKDRLEKSKSVQASMEPEMIEKIKDGPLGKALQGIDFNDVIALVNYISNNLNLWKNMGYYVETISNNLRSEITLKAELQQQYDVIEIMPPASEILDREIERRIAEKQHLQPVDQQQIIEEAKQKK